MPSWAGEDCGIQPRITQSTGVKIGEAKEVLSRSSFQSNQSLGRYKSGNL
jgi:hypothetical protein